MTDLVLAQHHPTHSRERARLTELQRWAGGGTLLSCPEPGFSAEIEALQRSDTEAWNALFRSEMPLIYRYTLSRTGVAQEAEDLTSQVFAEAWEHAGALKDQGSLPRAWLFGIARNLVNSRRRKLFRRPPALSLEAFDYCDEDSRLDPDLMDLAAAIASLPAKHAEVVVLRFIHGLSLAETASVLKTTLDGVKGRQSRALTELRRRLVAVSEEGAAAAAHRLS